MLNAIKNTKAFIGILFISCGPCYGDDQNKSLNVLPPCLTEWKAFDNQDSDIDFELEINYAVNYYDDGLEVLRDSVSGTSWIEDRYGEKGEIVTKHYFSINSTGCIGTYFIQNLEGNYSKYDGPVTFSKNETTIFIGAKTKAVTAFPLCIHGDGRYGKNRTPISGCDINGSKKYKVRYYGPQ